MITDSSPAVWQRWLNADGAARRIVEPKPLSPFPYGSRVVKVLRRLDGTPFFAELIPSGDEPSQVFAGLAIGSAVALEQQFAAQKYRLAVDDMFFGNHGGGGLVPPVFSDADRADYKTLYVRVFGIEQPQVTREVAERHAENCLNAPAYHNVLLRAPDGSVAAIGSVVRGEGVNLYYNIAVAPARRRGGYGRKIMAELMQYAAPDTPGLLECTNEPWLNSFYEKAGFVSLARGEIWTYP